MAGADTPTLEQLIEDVARLVCLPEVYYRLEEAIQHPKKSLDDIGAVISSDPDLAARLLKIANSALFAFPAQIESIPRALSTVGTQQVRDLALATQVVRLFARLPLGMVSMRSFWEHSVAVAVTARVIAERRAEANIERFYLAGLLHDVGRLVLYMECPDVMRGLLVGRDEPPRLLYELERETLGYDHAAVGGALLEAWSLPQGLAVPVATHHAPETASGHDVEAAAVHVADVIVNGLRFGSSGEHYVPPLNEAAWALLGIAPEALPEITQRALAQTRDAMALFVDV